ncbi:sensor histidine kinase [Hyphomicrobium zavarzinii]|uniref:sensor histidine kinase n=1 Tax=Hyphomicrobium zavarzinii TaxID=48292 RepID=UPI0003720D02|nr:sensor histidine kinase [Hyphomicrobium zavarzinii]
MKEPASLKNRLIVAATAWIAFGMVLAWLILSNVFRTHVTQQFYDELFVHLSELKRLAHTENGQTVLRAPLSDPRYDVENSGYYWEIQQKGKVLARSPSMKAAPLTTPPDGRSDVGVHTHHIKGPTGELLVAESLEWKNPGEPPVQFIIGTDKRHLESVVTSFNDTLSWSLTALGVAMAAAAALLILYAMRPLGQLNVALLKMRSANLKCLPGNYPSEVQPLVDNLNYMFASTTELVQRARTQAGNIAHGLRTPLAILTDEAYRLKSCGCGASADTILAQCRKMEAQINHQTTRARVVANRLSPGASSEVASVVSDVIAALSRIYAHKQLHFDVDVPPAIRAACEAQDLQEILGNIIDNAGKFAHSRVRIAANETKSGSVEILVDDDGPGLPPEAHEVVFNVGERWDTQAAGSGLGLAIVRDLVVLYNGEIQLDTSPLDGLRVSIRLPSA